MKRENASNIVDGALVGAISADVFGERDHVTFGDIEAICIRATGQPLISSNERVDTWEGRRNGGPL